MEKILFNIDFLGDVLRLMEKYEESFILYNRALTIDL